MERRDSPREEAELQVEILLDGSNCFCLVKNYSSSGALLCVASGGNCSLGQDQVGMELTFGASPELPEVFQRKARIVRFLDTGDNLFFAVFFVKHS